MARKANYRVFISHAAKDKWVAVQLDRMIAERNIATFRDDRDVEGGAAIAGAIRRQMRRCREMLVLWTPQAVESEWVVQEVGMAFGLGLFIVPIRHMTDTASLPGLIGNVHSPELTVADVEKYLKQLQQRARKRR